jgi:ketosteroid isomerase-like protein
VARGDPTAEGSCQNRDQALAFMRQSQVIRGGSFELVNVAGAGDKVVVIMRPPSDDDTPAAPVANLTTFRDGKVVEMVHYPNPRRRARRRRRAEPESSR